MDAAPHKPALANAVQGHRQGLTNSVCRSQPLTAMAERWLSPVKATRSRFKSGIRGNDAHALRNQNGLCMNVVAQAHCHRACSK